VVRGVTVRPAYLSQDVAELDASLRVLEAVESVRRVVDLGKGRTMTAAQLCERFGFVGNAAWTPVGELSGGERRRLQVLRLLMDEPNVLLLDEPTNDLDIDTLTALEDLLDGWPGTLLVVSHDRYFLERVCDRVVALLGDGRLRDLPGGVEEYLALRRSAEVTPSEDVAAAAGPGEAALTRSARKELARVERRLDKLRDREARLHEDLAAVATDHERVLELDRQLALVADERAALEDRWFELAESLDG
jgi:ATP-binding cassette subfamily F protein uup